MGQEIPTTRFTPQDFDQFYQRLKEETRLLGEWSDQGRFQACEHNAGFEVEAWLINKDGSPAAVNEAYLRALDSRWVTPELSKFNIELNTKPEPLHGDALSRLEQHLQQNWDRCEQVAESMDIDLVTIGILPSLQEQDLSIQNMSEMQRYHALNERVFAMRQGRPLKIDIAGTEQSLQATHYNVMLEASTTSFQVHLQVQPREAARFYNASILASAFTVAASANSPFLFGRQLWEETRIPLFEQAVAVGGYEGAAFGPIRRVGFGSGYIKSSLMECFLENLNHYPVMLPILFDDAGQLEHLRIHNGTIWRWNRPLIGFDSEGNPTVRLEHRVIAGGPTVVDMIANAAFYYGISHYLSALAEAPEKQVAFERARDNFYEAARKGLQAQVSWLEGRRCNIRELILSEVLDMAQAGLEKLALDANEIDEYLGIIRARVDKGQHGAFWQRMFVNKYGADMFALVEAYVQHQKSGRPVHTWTI